MENFKDQKESLRLAINNLADRCHAASYASGWWHDADSGASLLEPPLRRYAIPTKIALIHSETSEALEGDRVDAMDDKLPHRKAIICELADTVIRCGDLAAALGGDKLGDVILEKMAFNAVRPDHQTVNRRKPGGKAY